VFVLVHGNVKAVKGNLLNNAKKRVIGYEVKDRDRNEDKVLTYYLALNNSRVLVITTANSF